MLRWHIVQIQRSCLFVCLFVVLFARLFNLFSLILLRKTKMTVSISCINLCVWMFHITEIFNQSFRWGRFQIWKQRSRVLFLLDNETDSFVAFEFLVF